MSPEQPREDDPFSGHARSEASSVTAVQDAAAGNKLSSSSRNQTAMRLRSLGSRHVLVKDTAFQTYVSSLCSCGTDRVDDGIGGIRCSIISTRITLASCRSVRRRLVDTLAHRRQALSTSHGVPPSPCIVWRPRYVTAKSTSLDTGRERAFRSGWTTSATRHFPIYGATSRNTTSSMNSRAASSRRASPSHAMYFPFLIG